MADSAERHYWRGQYPILSPDHHAELEARSAIHELGSGLNRVDAEHKAHEDYFHGHMRRAAAHHLAGQRAASAAGDVEDAARHGIMYGMLARTLGFSATDPPPDDIAASAKDNALSPVYDYRPHTADMLVMEHLRRRGILKDKPLKKSEAPEAGVPIAGVPQEDGSVDMTHLLPRMRREAGERLVVLEHGPGPATVHHLREEGGRRVPLSTLVREDGVTKALGDAAPGDVVQAADLAFRVRAGVDAAQKLERLRRVASAIELTRRST